MLFMELDSGIGATLLPDHNPGSDGPAVYSMIADHQNPRRRSPLPVARHMKRKEAAVRCDFLPFFIKKDRGTVLLSFFLDSFFG